MRHAAPPSRRGPPSQGAGLLDGHMASLDTRGRRGAGRGGGEGVWMDGDGEGRGEGDGGGR